MNTGCSCKNLATVAAAATTAIAATAVAAATVTATITAVAVSLGQHNIYTFSGKTKKIKAKFGIPEQKPFYMFI